MGGPFSKEEKLDVTSKPDLGIVACVIYKPNAMKLIHAPDEVKRCMIGVLRDVNKQTYDTVRCTVLKSDGNL